MWYSEVFQIGSFNRWSRNIAVSSYNEKGHKFHYTGEAVSTIQQIDERVADYIRLQMRGCKTPNDIQCRVEYFVKQNTFGGLRVKEFISSTKKIRNLILRWFYTRRNVRGISLRYRFFFCSCTCVKVLVADAFLKCRFRWKVEIISTFPLRPNVVFFLNQSF